MPTRCILGSGSFFRHFREGFMEGVLQTGYSLHVIFLAVLASIPLTAKRVFVNMLVIVN